MKQPIKISKDASGRIMVAFSYDPAWVEEVKSIEGTSGTLPKNTGVFPYSEGVVGKILSIFPGENIYIDPVLQVSIPPKADTLAPIRHSQPPISSNYGCFRRYTR